MSNNATIAPLLAVVRQELRSQRANRQARAQLGRELAQYSSPADRLELEAIMERHTSEQTADIRFILDQQLAAG